MKTPPTPQPVTETGRMVSAILAAGAVGCLSLLAAHLYGTLAATCVGVLLLANSHLYELAHYLKEDTALAFGVSFFFLALTRCWLGPSKARFAMLGAAAALAVSGKYIGALVIPFAIASLFWSRRERGRNALVLCGAFAAVLLVVNYPIFASLGNFSESLGREVDFTVRGHKGLTRSVPHGVYTAVFWAATNPAIWFLLGVYYARLLTFWRRIHPVEWALALFPLIYVLVLSFSPKTHHRYFLPDTLLFSTLAVFGLSCFKLPGPAVITRALQTATFVAAFGFSSARLIAYDSAFTIDARQQLLAFIRQNVPPDAIIAQDRRVNLPHRGDPRHVDSRYFVEQKIVGGLLAADAGSIDELRIQGVRYVAVSEGDYGRFFLRTHKPTKDSQPYYDQQKDFYERLFREGKLLWESKPGLLPYLQPRIRFYYLPADSRPDQSGTRISPISWTQSGKILRVDSFPQSSADYL